MSNRNVPWGTQFYLLRLQAFRIGESKLAPLFTVEAGPSEERTAGGVAKKEFAERDKRRFEFFEQLLSKANIVTSIFNSVSPVGYQNWVNAGAGKAGIMWTFVAMKKTARTEFFLCHSKFETNKTRYEKLLAQKEDIEQIFEEPLNWDFNDSRKQQYVRSICPIGGLDSEDKWVDIQNDLVKRLIRLEKAIGPNINSL